MIIFPAALYDVEHLAVWCHMHFHSAGGTVLRADIAADASHMGVHYAFAVE